jgi:glycosyltransferase involved in cell wall biosynthesis
METEIETRLPGRAHLHGLPIARRLVVSLIGNYETDQQESMQRFASLLARQLPDRAIDVHLIAPQPLFGRLKKAPVGLGKWLGYVDKFIIFPFLLKRRLSRIARRPDASLIVHICDHSNAPYLLFLRNFPTVITCHDMLAIRGALGDPKACCSASYTGKILQRWILSSLHRASSLACVSSATRRDLLSLAPDVGVRTRLILNGLNYPYSLIDDSERESRLGRVPSVKGPFILHVGSSQRRKNRDGVLEIFRHLRRRWDGWLVFAGQPLTDELRKLAVSLGVSDRVVEVIKPDNDLLEAIYNKAFALIFPSRSEGFGWPIIEAQSCGCPVVCSRGEPFDEIGGDSMLQADADSPEDFSNLLFSLTSSSVRNNYRERGFNNASRFGVGRMVSDYVQLYNELIRD